MKNRTKCIKYSHILQTHNMPVTKQEQANEIFTKIAKDEKHFNIQVSQDQRNTIHPDKSLQILYFNQLSRIS